MQGYNYNRPHRRGGGGHNSQPRPQSQQQPQPPALDPSFAFQNANNYQQLQAQAGASYFPFQNLNFPYQNLNLLSQLQNFLPQHVYGDQSYSQPQPQSGSVVNEAPKDVLAIVEETVAKARRSLIAAGENVSTWKVSQSALLELQIDSWTTLGCQMQEVPPLRRLMLVEERINAFISCFLGVRTMTTLYELEKAICENEGIKNFEELELGPFLSHPLIVQYFMSSSKIDSVVKITCQDIVSCLCKYMKTHDKKEIRVGDFLDFVAVKRSVTGKDKLGVRIQNIGLYIDYISKAKRLEDATLIKRQGLKLKKRYINMTDRVESFYNVQKDFCGKHIRFDLSSSEEEDSNCSGRTDDNNDNDVDSCSEFLSEVANSSDRPSSCPYPSATEEMKRLRVRDGVNSTTPASGKLRHNQSVALSNKDRKRKPESPNSTGSKQPKLLKKDKGKNIVPLDENSEEWRGFVYNYDGDMSLSNNLLNVFVTTWKEACKEHTVKEVLERMLLFYKPKVRRKMKSFYLSHPFVGLLNVAVTSIKNGMWDSTYDAIQAINIQELTNISDNNPEFESIEIEPSEKDISIVSKLPVQRIHSVTTEEVISKLSTYFLQGRENWRSKTAKDKNIVLLRKLYDCGSWLAEQYSVKEFRLLGFGDLFTFLENNVSLLPKELEKLLAGGSCDTSSLEFCILQQLLILLVSQASHNLGEDEIINEEMISALLMRQFPLIRFKSMENSSMGNFLENVKNFKNDVMSTKVIFSAPLLGHANTSVSNGENCFLEAPGGRNENAVQAYKFGTSKDALDVLLRAPMLSDLYSWSHWDVVFAPSLGPLVVWLLNEVNVKELLCLVTKDGKILRVDHLATLDSFLEAALNGSSFETAVKLLSVYSLSGGMKHLPLSLLKCYARQAVEVIFKNQLEDKEITDGQTSRVYSKTIAAEQMVKSGFADCLGGEFQMKGISEAVASVSDFVLDCLSYLPSEFRGFAADIFLDGMKSVIKDSPSTVLSQCKQPAHRLMLHEIGLSLGIVEWIDDYNAFISASARTGDLPLPSDCKTSDKGSAVVDLRVCSNTEQNAGNEVTSCSRLTSVSQEINKQHGEPPEDCNTIKTTETSGGEHDSGKKEACVLNEEKDAAMVVESIRRDEFGIDPNLSEDESSMLKKQHARLGRALHCLSQELYSQDSHFLLELVQNADDNIYSENVEPTLTFILQESGIVVMNNEEGFSAQNIRALCDIGNSTKKECTGYIGKKGIGFKSVFRVTDAPEIHSNGFHVKFDISDGQIGFVLPTLIPPCDLADFRSRLSGRDTLDDERWNTCIVLPFRPRMLKGIDMNNVVSMFTDLHPSLLLFLHRLKRIVFQNMLNHSLTIMRKEIIGNGIVKVSCADKKMTWLVESKKLQADTVARDAKVTEISIAFTLQELEDGCYRAVLDQQPVFAFLPLRTYGLKFIIQGDFVLPSSREEVDGDSAWNQWLLSEFPSLFLSAERSFCALPCFSEYPGRGVTAYMSFVPLVGEVHGFFCSLPRMITSKLRMSNCLLLEGDKNQWVPPCKVLRGWNEQARCLLPDELLYEHLGLGFLDRDIVLSESLAGALGVEEYGAKVLVQILSSLCGKENGLKSMGLEWLSSWLNEFCMMSFHSFGQASIKSGVERDFTEHLRKIPFIPLSSGTFSSLDEGTIWLHSDVISSGFDGGFGLEVFPSLSAKLRLVNPALLSVNNSSVDVSLVGNITRVLTCIGVQQLTAHDIVKVHILPAMADIRMMEVDRDLMIDYLCFVMFHLQTSCSSCCVERSSIISELQSSAFVLTNHGFKRPIEVPVHFSPEFDSPVNFKTFISVLEMKWHLVDSAYLNHPATKSQVMKWREFFQEIGVSDFVQVIEVKKSFTNMSDTILEQMLSDRKLICSKSVAKDWESHELAQLLSLLSASGNQEGCKYLMEVLDKLWDDKFSDKVTGDFCFKSGGDVKTFKSSFMCNIRDAQWVASSLDDELHYPCDLFHDCDTVRLIFGERAPYAVPKVKSEKLVKDIGFKTNVTVDDVLQVLKSWRSQAPFMASIAQMSRLYSFIWNSMPTSRKKIAEEFSSSLAIFIPYKSGFQLDDIVSGTFLCAKEVYWHDPTGIVSQIESISEYGSDENQRWPLNRTLCNVYPGLHDFFVNECQVPEKPSFSCYLDILLELSRALLPSQAANTVFQVLIKWADGLSSGELSSEDIIQIKDCLLKLEYKVLPTALDKWVSLHPSFGLVCLCDDEQLRKRFKHSADVDFLYFGNLNNHDRELLRTKMPALMRAIGIPILSEIVTREAVFDGLADCSFPVSFVNWALPFIQRYMSSFHPDKYLQLKQSEFDIKNLQVVVVEKLYYRNVINRCNITSKKRIRSLCLLQDTVLYTTLESDSHALFMELSRLLFDGAPDLHMANFLHMITTMAESGSTEEQTEFFIINSQKVEKLPDDESVWTLSSAANKKSLETRSESQYIWPPASWKTAPDLSTVAKSRKEGSGKKKRKVSEGIDSAADSETPSETNATTSIGKDPEGSTALFLPDANDADGRDQTEANAEIVLDQADLSMLSDVPQQGSSELSNRDQQHNAGYNPFVSWPNPMNAGQWSEYDASGFSKRDQLLTGTPSSAIAMRTGKLGELAAFKHFLNNSGQRVVNWVNKDTETGLPYDLLIEDEGGQFEYIEVKATRSGRKDWFNITKREWDFAAEKGDAFCIAHIFLSSDTDARLNVYRNPVKLCQLGKLQLVCMIPKQ